MSATARFWGGEISVDYGVRDDFSLGGNLTLMRRRVTSLNPQFSADGRPNVKMFLYAGYQPSPLDLDRQA